MARLGARSAFREVGKDTKKMDKAVAKMFEKFPPQTM
jgi:hypothetical protein